MWVAPLAGSPDRMKGTRKKVSARSLCSPFVTEWPLSAMYSWHHNILPEHMGPTDCGLHAWHLWTKTRNLSSLFKNWFAFILYMWVFCLYVYKSTVLQPDAHSGHKRGEVTYSIFGLIHVSKTAYWVSSKDIVNKHVLLSLRVQICIWREVFSEVQQWQSLVLGMQ